MARDRSERAARTLDRAGAGLAAAGDAQAAVEAVCDAAVACGYPLAWYGRAEHDGPRTVTPIAAAGAADYVDAHAFSWAEDETGMGPTGLAIRTGEPQTVQDITAKSFYSPWRMDALDHGLHASISVPVVLDGGVHGAFMACAAERYAFGDPQVLAVFVALAERLGERLEALS